MKRTFLLTLALTAATPALAEASNPGAGFAILAMVFAAYFFPTGIAIMRGHSNALAIGMFNLFLGWTFLGWIAAFIWSCTNSGQSNNSIVINNHR